MHAVLKARQDLQAVFTRAGVKGVLRSLPERQQERLLRNYATMSAPERDRLENLVKLCRSQFILQVGDSFGLSNLKVGPKVIATASLVRYLEAGDSEHRRNAYRKAVTDTSATLAEQKLHAKEAVTLATVGAAAGVFTAGAGSLLIGKMFSSTLFSFGTTVMHSRVCEWIFSKSAMAIVGYGTGRLNEPLQKRVAKIKNPMVRNTLALGLAAARIYAMIKMDHGFHDLQDHLGLGDLAKGTSVAPNLYDRLYQDFTKHVDHLEETVTHSAANAIGIAGDKTATFLKNHVDASLFGANLGVGAGVGAAQTLIEHTHQAVQTTLPTQWVDSSNSPFQWQGQACSDGLPGWDAQFQEYLKSEKAQDAASFLFGASAGQNLGKEIQNSVTRVVDSLSESVKAARETTKTGEEAFKMTDEDAELREKFEPSNPFAVSDRRLEFLHQRAIGGLLCLYATHEKGRSPEDALLRDMALEQLDALNIEQEDGQSVNLGEMLRKRLAEPHTLHTGDIFLSLRMNDDQYASFKNMNAAQRSANLVMNPPPGYLRMAAAQATSLINLPRQARDSAIATSSGLQSGVSLVSKVAVGAYALMHKIPHFGKALSDTEKDVRAALQAVLKTQAAQWLTRTAQSSGEHVHDWSRKNLLGWKMSQEAQPASASAPAAGAGAPAQPPRSFTRTTPPKTDPITTIMPAYPAGAMSMPS